MTHHLWTGPTLAIIAGVWTLASALITERARQLLQLSKVKSASGPYFGAADWPCITLVIPLSGADANEGLMFANAEAAAYSLPGYPKQITTILLAMADDPPAVDRAHRHAAALRQRGQKAHIQVTEPGGVNRKAAQLAQYSEASAKQAHPQAGLVLCLDSDVVPSTVDAQALVRLLHQPPRAAAVWQAVVPILDRATGPRAKQTFGDRVDQAVRAGSGHAFAILAALDGSSLVGKTILYDPHAVAMVGGWRPSIPYLGDDVALSQRLIKAKYRVRALAQPCAAEARANQKVGQVLHRYRRWNAIMFAQRPHMLWTYPLYLFALTGQLTLWAISMAQGLPAAVGLIGALTSIAGRVLLARCARRSSGNHATWPTCLMDTLLAEPALLVCFGAAAITRRVQWHGRPLTAARAKTQ